MEIGQAKGYLLEYEVLRLLKKSDYVNVKKGQVRGRGAQHQIDGYGVFSIPTAFVYPIRLLSESKCYKDPVELEVVRNFVGVIKDISENYVVAKTHKRNSLYRYTDAGCIFSASPFVQSAQEYAWAHNIFLVSFLEMTFMEQILTRIDQSARTPAMAAILNDNEGKKQERIIKEHKHFSKYNRLFDPTLVVGILDNIYPVILVGTNDWIRHIKPPKTNDKLDAQKDFRQDFSQHGIIESNSRNNEPLQHVFHISIQGQPITFSLPHFAAMRILRRIRKSVGNEKIAAL